MQMHNPFYLSEVHKMLEAGVEMGFFAEGTDAPEVGMVDMSIHSEQPFKNCLDDLQEVLRERVIVALWKEAWIINLQVRKCISHPICSLCIFVKEESLTGLSNQSCAYISNIYVQCVARRQSSEIAVLAADTFSILCRLYTWPMHCIDTFASNRKMLYYQNMFFVYQALLE